MTMASTGAFDRILDALTSVTGLAPRGRTQTRMARCPSHDDNTPSLSVTRSTDRVLLNCRAGCDVDTILASLGLQRRDLFDEPRQAKATNGYKDNGVRPRKVAEYPYTDEEGRILYTIQRWEPGKDGKRKSFLTAYPNGRTSRRVVYRLAEVMAAACDGRVIYVVEGEKDADRLAEMGHVATTSVHGAGSWRTEYAEPFAGASVVVVADRDDPGLAHARTIAAGLSRVGCDVRIVQPAVERDHADISDHLDAGLGIEDLIPVDFSTEAGNTLTSGDTVGDTVPDDLAELHEPDEPATWAPADLTDILAGTYVPEAPTLMARTDGQHLLYAGRTHSMHGESESGKSLVAQAVAADILLAGGRVLYIDYESDAPAVVGRLRELGVPAHVIRERFHYVHPEVSPFSREAETVAWAALLSAEYNLAIIDGVTDALGTNGVKTNDNDEIAAWCRRIARPIARRTGAAVILIDHVTKDADTRGRFALGGQAKMNALDGAAYVVEVAEALGRGLKGAVTLRVAKDRPGGVRGHCGTFRKLDRTQEAARVTIDSRRPNQIKVTIEPPSTGTNPAEKSEFRPTALMERVSQFLVRNSPSSLRKVRESVSGKAAYIDAAVTCLVSEEYLTSEAGPRGSLMLTHVRNYFEATDPKGSGTVSRPCPDRVPDMVEPHSFDRVPVSLPLRGGDTVEGGPAILKQDHRVPPNGGHGVDAIGNCLKCGWDPDSVGHIENCGGN